MRQKNRYFILVTAVCFCLCLLMAVSTGTSVSAAGGKNKLKTKWQIDKKIVISKKDVKYYACLSKNKKESWIYKIQLKKKVKKLQIPKTIKRAPVTRIGFGKELYGKGSEWECYKNVFGDRLEPWHGWYGTDSVRKNAITEMTLPKTLKVIESASFCGMQQLENIKIPDKVQKINRYSLAACPALRSVSFPANMSQIDCYAFDKTTNVWALSIKENAKKYSVFDGFLLTKSGTHLVWTASAKENVVIPNTVTSIGQNALLASQANRLTIPNTVNKIGNEALSASKLQNVVLQPGNEKYEMQDNCLYTKEEKMLVGVLITGLKIQISDKVKIMGEYVSVMGSMELEGDNDTGIEAKEGFSVHIPASVEKVIDHWMFFGSKAEVYFYGKKPPVIQSKVKGSVYTALPTWNKVYVPKGTENTYIKWAKDRDGLTWNDLQEF